jgi:hypothetical protein
MNGNRCPNCELLNLPSATICLQCKTPLSKAPQTAPNVSTPTVEYSESTAQYSQPGYSQNTPFNPASSAIQDSKTGQRTHFWYRIFCSIVVIPGIVIAIIGFVAIIGSFGENVEDANSAFAGGIMFMLVGGVPALFYFFGVVLPAKPFHWFYGIFLLILGILSCGLAPLAIPLLIFWFKPETQAYFERK